MTQQRIKQLEQRLNEVYRLLEEVEQQKIVEINRPVEFARLSLDQSRLLRLIEQFQGWLEELKAGKILPKIGDIQLQPNEPAPINPFNQISIVTDRLFVGRSFQLQRIREALANKTSIILVGPPKIGKSSLMWQFLKSYQKEGRTVLQIDFKLPDMTMNDHYAELTSALGKPGHSFNDFARAIKGKQITLFIDEFELAVECGLTDRELLGFKALATDPAEQFQVVATSSVSAVEIYSGSSLRSAPYGFLMHEELEPFDDEEANELFDNYLGGNAQMFTNEIRQNLIQLTGGHPYKLQRAAFRFYETFSNPKYNWRKAYEQDVKPF